MTHAMLAVRQTCQEARKKRLPSKEVISAAGPAGGESERLLALRGHAWARALDEEGDGGARGRPIFLVRTQSRGHWRGQPVRHKSRPDLQMGTAFSSCFCFASEAVGWKRCDA